MMSCPPKNQCRLCSEFDCAMSKSSTVVGLRLHLFAKEAGVVIEVPGVEREPHLGVELLEGCSAAFEHGHGPNGFGGDTMLERNERRRIGAFGHTIVHQGEKSVALILVERVRAAEEESPRPFDPYHRAQSTGSADRDGVGRPCRRKAQPRADLQNRASGRVEEGLCAEGRGFEGLREQPVQCARFFIAEGSRGPDVEAVLCFNAVDVSGDPGASGGDEGSAPGLGEPW